MARVVADDEPACGTWHTVTLTRVFVVPIFSLLHDYELLDADGQALTAHSLGDDGELAAEVVLIRRQRDGKLFKPSPWVRRGAHERGEVALVEA